MQKRLLYIFLILTQSYLSYGQIFGEKMDMSKLNGKPRIYYGIKAGLNYSFVSMKNIDVDVYKTNSFQNIDIIPIVCDMNLEPISSPFISVMAEFRLKNWFSLQAELAYSTNYAIGIINSTGELQNYYTATHKMLMESIDMPVSIKFYMHKYVPITLGGYINYATKSVITDIKGEQQLRIPNYFNRLSSGVFAGLGINTKLGITAEINLRCNLINPILEQTQINTIFNNDNEPIKLNLKRGDSYGYNYVLNLSVGYLF